MELFIYQLLEMPQKDMIISIVLAIISVLVLGFFIKNIVEYI